MHTFAAARRPKAVYGRIRGAQRSRPRESSESSDGDSEAENAAVASESDGDASEGEVHARKNGKPSGRTAASQSKGKARAVPAPRKPMQPRRAHANVKAIVLSDDDDEDGAIRSPQQRRRARGLSSGPIVIASSPSSSSCDSFASFDSVNELTQHLQAAAISDEEGSVKSAELQQEEDEPSEQSERSLFKACDVSSVIAFEDALDGIEQHAKSKKWNKIGEASYSEVYSLVGSGMVLKVIPLQAQATGSPGGDEGNVSNATNDSVLTQPECSLSENVRREVQMTRALTDTHSAFVTLHRALVVHGRYSMRLLDAWDEHRRKKKDQNVRPSTFSEEQEYCMLLLRDGGKDLESFTLSSWTEAASVICQVAQALAKAEELCEFEHRDLHWGNVVINAVPKQGRRLAATKQLGFSQLSSPRWSGVQATIIDFSLSRACFKAGATSVTANATDDVIAYPFDDEELFKGEGDIQFDVYRSMRKVTQDDWQAYFPLTNVLWMRYLIAKVMDDKKLPAPEAEKEESAMHGEQICHSLLQGIRDALDDDNEKVQVTTVNDLCDTIISQLMTLTRRAFELDSD